MERMNCDVFVKKDSIFSLDNSICITGNFYAGVNSTVFAVVDTEGSVFLGDNAYVDTISAKSDVFVGDFSEAISIDSEENVFLGNHSLVTEVCAAKDVFIGYRAETCNVTTGGDIRKGSGFNLLTLFKKIWLEWNH